MAFDRSSRYEAADAAEAVYAELGRVYVEPGAEGEPAILDEERLRTLAAWVDALVPGDGEWPSASELATVAYVDRTIALAPRLRPVVLGALDEVRDETARRYGSTLHEAAIEQRSSVLSWFEERAPLAFSLLKELTYEAYYRDPAVAAVVERRTGFRARRPVEGVAMDSYDRMLELLADIAERPSLVREAPA